MIAEALVLTVRNVNEALPYAVQYLADPRALPVTPRGAPTLEWPTPVTTCYVRPRERVLFLAARDANPFFHLFESLWMLAGRRDVEFPAAMVKRMVEFSDNGRYFNGAYGHRWRVWFGRDQLEEIIEELQRNGASRRVVMGMWDPQQDLGLDSKDLPCNTHLYFKVRDGKLRMTICCRSNDVLWGAYGANAVHFSILQEYVASRLNVDVGTMYQLSDSWHIYTGGAGGELWARLLDLPSRVLEYDPYAAGVVSPMPLGVGESRGAWDADLRCFFALWDAGAAGHVEAKEFLTPWWRDTAVPMWRAWYHRRADELRGEGMATDWQTAGLQWLSRRGVTR